MTRIREEEEDQVILCQIPKNGLSPNLSKTRASMSRRRLSKGSLAYFQFRGHLPEKTQGVKQVLGGRTAEIYCSLHVARCTVSFVYLVSFVRCTVSELRDVNWPQIRIFTYFTKQNS